MAIIARCAAQTITDVSDRIRRRQMAEKHAHQMRPAVDPFMVFVRRMLANKDVKKTAVDQTKNLRKYVYIYHGGV
jgi:hypothetical protein